MKFRKKLKYSIICIILLAFITTFFMVITDKYISSTLDTLNSKSKGVLYTKETIENNLKKLSNNEMDIFLEWVEKSLNQEIVTVADKISLKELETNEKYKSYYSILPSKLKENEYLYKHSFYSIGAYFNISDGNEWSYKDGQTNDIWKDLRFYDTQKRSMLVDNLEILSFAYILGKSSSDKELSRLGELAGKKAAEWMKKWFVDEDTFMLPEMCCAAIKPNSDEPMAAQVITTVFLIYVLDAYYLIEDSGFFTLNEKQSIKNWFKKYSNWLIEDIRGQKECLAINNHGVWYDAQLLTFLNFVGDKESKKLAIEHLNNYSFDRLATQIKKDGSMPKELQRSKAVHYTIYNLEAFITLAEVSNQLGINLYRVKDKYNQEYIKNAIMYVISKSNQSDSIFYEYSWIKKYNYLILANKEYNDSEINSIIRINEEKCNNIILKLKSNY